MTFTLGAALEAARNLALSLMPGPYFRRAPGWPALERKCFARDGWRCVICGRLITQAPKDMAPGEKRVPGRGHHKRPVHLFPELELVEENVATVCQPIGGGDHLRVGHTNEAGKRGWKYWNPNFDRDAAAELAKDGP